MAKRAITAKAIWDPETQSLVDVSRVYGLTQDVQAVAEALAQVSQWAKEVLAQAAETVVAKASKRMKAKSLFIFEGGKSVKFVWEVMICLFWFIYLLSW